MPSHNFKNITGQKFNKLKVISRAENDKFGKTRWYCLCDCGNKTIVSKSNLMHRKQISCGCYKNKLTSKRFFKHGHNRKGKNIKPSITYNTWCSMNQRCKVGNKTDPSYAEKNRKVCKHWKIFTNFLFDMGERPSPEYSIDRIDNNGHYSCGHCKECHENSWPMNCRWATKIVQMNNRNDTHLITYKNQTLSMAEWSRKLNVNYHTLRSRIYQLEWSPQKAFETPFRS